MTCDHSGEIEVRTHVKQTSGWCIAERGARGRHLDVKHAAADGVMPVVYRKSGCGANKNPGQGRSCAHSFAAGAKCSQNTCGE